MIVFIVIVLSSIFNLLSCATFHHIQPVHAIPKTTLKLRTYESLENYEFPELEDFDYNNDEAPFFPKENTLLEFLRKAFGKVARIHCIGAGYPPPNITWTKNNEEIVRHMGTVQYKKWAIILEDLTPKDAGDYTCKLCNIHGCIDHTTKLLVEDRFSSSLYFIKEQIVNGTATVNGNITFKCPVIQTERAAHIKWIKFHALNDSDAPPNAVLLEVDDYKSEELTLHNITHADEGWYKCIAVNNMGFMTAYAYLHVVDENGPNIETKDIVGVQLAYGIAILLGLFVVLFLFCFLQERIKRVRLKKHFQGNPRRIKPQHALNEQAHHLPYKKEFEFPREQIKLEPKYSVH